MKCPVCDSNEVSIIYPSPFEELEMNQSIAECAECELGFSVPSLSKVALSSLYSEDYPPTVEKIRPSKLSNESLVQQLYRQYVDMNISLYLWFKPKSIFRKFFMLDLTALFPVKCFSLQLSKDDEFLDYGAGNWYFVKLLRKLGYKAFGFDIFYEARQQEWFYDVEAGNKLFDEIRMFHVLEHVEDPIEALESVVNKLKPNGRLVIGVPNFTSPLHRIGENGGHFHLPYHRVHFSEQALRIALEKAGLRVDKIITRSTETGYVSYLINDMVSDAKPLDKIFLKIKSTILDALRKGDAYEV